MIWPLSRLRKKNTPTLTAIFIASSAGEPMECVDETHAVRDRGLEGDRYFNNTGHWQLLEGCQVTLITTTELQRAQKRTDIDLANGGHRRNLVIDGVRLSALEGKRFQVGEAVFEYHKPRPPCGYIDQVSGKGIGRALSHNSGICLRIIESGRIKCGDAVILNL